MYNFVFYFFYKYFESRKDFSPRFSSLCAVAGAQFIHAFFLVTTLKYFFNISILPNKFSDSYLINKLYWSPTFLIWLILVYFYYTSARVTHIVDEKNKLNKKVFTFMNIITIILVIGLPLFLGIMFIKLGQKI